MRNMTKMMLLNKERDGQTDMRYPDMGYGMENQNRSNDRGTETGGRATRGTLTWDNTRGAESAYRDGYGGRNYPQHEDSKMNYPRSEMDGYYPGPNYPPPVYERMNQIGFAANDGSEHNNLHMIRGGAYEKSEKLDDKTIEKWMRGLQNEDGTVGAHWTKDQTTQVMKQKNLDCDPNEFYVAMNLMYSDFFNAAKKANANNVDFYVNMAKAFLDDKDAGTNDKIAAYYEYIVK